MSTIYDDADADAHNLAVWKEEAINSKLAFALKSARQRGAIKETKEIEDELYRRHVPGLVEGDS